VPRKRRIALGGQIYHVLNRSVGKRRLFRTLSDYEAFETLLVQAVAKTGIRILAYCLMPNHWHFLLWPIADRDLQKFVQWLTSTHATRWNAARKRVGQGAVYQSRFKSVPVNSEEYLFWVWRYVERNALRANLVTRAEDWRWCSLWHRQRQCKFLSAGPYPIPSNWVEIVNKPQTQGELDAFRKHIATGAPYIPGESAERKRGRPRIYDTYE
jgi:putative transposase